MLQRARARTRESAAALGQVVANPDLRRLQLATAASTVVNWMSGVALAVIAFRAGGAAAVGILGGVRLVPSIFLTPLAGVVADRYPKVRIMLLSALTRAVILAGISVAAFDHLTLALVVGLATLASSVGCVTRPAQTALIPMIARSPEELTANNVVAGASEAIGAVGGPALAGLLLIVTTPAIVILLVAAAAICSTLALWRVAEPPAPPAPDPAPAVGPRLGIEILTGFRVIATTPGLRLLTGLYAAQTLIAGALGVLTVSLALTTLQLGQPGVGYLDGSLAAGGVIGVLGSFVLIGRRRLAAPFGIGLVLWGLPILLIGVAPGAAVAVAMLLLVGLGNTVVDVAAVTLLQRAVEGRVLARAYGAMEGLLRATMVLGTGLVPLLILSLGLRRSLVVVGALLPIVTVLAWPGLRAIDRRAEMPLRGLALLRRLPLFQALPEPVLEALAQHLTERRVAAGEVVVRAGDVGDLYYAIESGSVAVTDGERLLATQGPGEGFGEIALLRDVSRTATVTAKTDTVLLSVDRDEFITAVTGHPTSRAAADALVASRLAGSVFTRGTA
ncbi:MAG TPA: MFS transporter [Verrucomicrobiae bacterium]|nr:MFS transporter [Verrucomicrobiae bacterium]